MQHGAFTSVWLALLVFLNLPMAATRGILALVVRGLSFSVSVSIDFITVVGVAVLNAW